MASPPPGPDLGAGPPPAEGVGAPTPNGPLVAGQPGGGGRDPKQIAQDVMAMGNELDRALLAMTRIITTGQEELGQARKLIQAGLAKYLSSVGSAASASPTAVGPSFPGGGFGSVKSSDST